MNKKRCPACGKRAIERRDVQSSFTPSWKKFKKIVLVVPLELKQCTHCNEVYISGEDAQRIDKVVETSIRTWTRVFIESIIEESSLRSQVQLAEILGMSPEHLNRLFKESHTPDHKTYKQIRAIAMAPKKIQEAMLSLYDDEKGYEDYEKLKKKIA